MDLSNTTNMSRYVTFKLADNMAGINILDIREIVPYIKITPVAKSPEFVLGLINLRGQILVVFDIGVLLGLEKRTFNKDSHIILFKHKDVGFIVDRIGDVITMDKEVSDDIPANIDSGIKEYMEKIINFSGDILVILDAGKILSKTLSGQPSAQGEL
ncbi:MAG: chemotaxis protein CheW [Proteobacteria bacterium]|nr:chemotaxis protein CheW [Pseudomonadota bacterium]MBU1387530.1 chemotaxis protein CheW [Pseudomonadota bacterium]MBU1544005.1 chemotaxis protein CheW [Pseudomonadota bacterium]MBU2431068.1 chemotaxis protein CheW [Pseudomonadota bacterium]MBU2479727.1 chemotaxis protein CheW [Pseudomonadota bacterium]